MSEYKLRPMSAEQWHSGAGLYRNVDMDELREKVRAEHAAYMEKWADWSEEQRRKRES